MKEAKIIVNERFLLFLTISLCCNALEILGAWHVMSSLWRLFCSLMRRLFWNSPDWDILGFIKNMFFKQSFQMKYARTLGSWFSTIPVWQKIAIQRSTTYDPWFLLVCFRRLHWRKDSRIAFIRLESMRCCPVNVRNRKYLETCQYDFTLLFRELLNRYDFWNIHGFSQTHLRNTRVDWIYKVTMTCFGNVNQPHFHQHS